MSPLIEVIVIAAFAAFVGYIAGRIHEFACKCISVEGAEEERDEALETKLVFAGKVRYLEAALEREKKKSEALFQERACFKLSAENYAKTETDLRSKLSRITDILAEIQ